MDLNIGYIESQLKETNSSLANYYKKARFWRCLTYLSLFAIVLLAFAAFTVRVVTRDYWFPVFLTAFMFPALALICFSMYRIQFWEDKAEFLGAFTPSLERALQQAYNSQNSD